MAQVLVNETSLVAIADAIRGKNGSADTYKPGEMAEAISSLPSGGVEVEPIVLTGDCSYACSGALTGAYIDLFGNTITTSGITACANMFRDNTSSIIPFEINLQTSSSASSAHAMSYLFYLCKNLKSIPKINNARPNAIDDIFHSCYNLKEIPEDFENWFDWSYMEAQTGQYSGNRSHTFIYCYSLRRIPMGFLNHGNQGVNYSYSIFYNLTQDCASLDEIVDLPNPHINATWTSNIFGNTVANCYRLKNFTFAMPDGAPYVVNWKSQLLNLSNYTGYAQSAYKGRMLNYNSGITADKEVTDDATYQALKNDPDWFTCNVAYSRYNHDSAVATINSLPDTSAYLATAGGTNTIKFKGAAGEKTDGGAINTLTAEEIAVATSRGWTVTLS